MQKAYFKGTHRVRIPEQTLEAIRPVLSQCGVTRLADVTDLDMLGIPVYMAVRPTSRTLSVSQGKAPTRTAAKVSGAMEAIELWHAENAVPSAVVTSTPSSAMALRFDITDLARPINGLVTDATPLDWIAARTMVSGEPTFVPRHCVHMDWTSLPGSSLRTVASSSNGLASGNSESEAAAHALYELIEREATANLAPIPVSEREYLDPDSVAVDYCQELIGKLRNASAWFELVRAPTRFAVSCFVCYLGLDDYGLVSAGSGAHRDPGVALSRAITEAAQNRLTYISGTRDDLDPAVYRSMSRPARFPATAPTHSWQELVPASRHPIESDVDEAYELARDIAETTGAEPIIVELTTASEATVVKVFAPGVEQTLRHHVPRPEHSAPATEKMQTT